MERINMDKVGVVVGDLVNLDAVYTNSWYSSDATCDYCDCADPGTGADSCHCEDICSCEDYCSCEDSCGCDDVCDCED